VTHSPYDNVVHKNTPSIGELLGWMPEQYQEEGTEVCRMGCGSGYLRSGCPPFARPLAHRIGGDR
jgi:hypothetical protein